MCEMGTFEKIMAFLTALVFGLLFYALFIIESQETTTIGNVTYYCDNNQSYYYEYLGTTSTTLIPIFNGKTTMLMPRASHDKIKRTLDYNICETHKLKENKNEK